jgi:D-serine deaminase-like pyridoxal phosphate-dependent protein
VILLGKRRSRSGPDDGNEPTIMTKHQPHRRPEIGAALSDLSTPAVVVDLDRLEANLRSWQAAITSAGARFRPHIKTHKIVEIAEEQLAIGACGIASAKVSEAEVFVAAGIRDIVLAYPVVGADKAERVAQMAARGTAVSVNVDSELGAESLSVAAVRHGTRIGAQLEVDTGLNRVGFRPDETSRLESLARFVMALPGLDLEGVTTHRGMGFEGAATMTRAEAGLAEGTLLVDVAEHLRARDIPIREVTAGSTITGRAVATVPGMTEVRAGTYVFNDLMQLEYGSAVPSDLALTILCTVVSHHGDRATIDGGSKTFAGDYRVNGPTPEESGYARALDRSVFVDRLSEEHGMITTGAGSVALGEKIAWIPSHVCPCVNLADEIYGVRDGLVEVVWRVEGRGKRT